ncbi:MarR family winged helix-turn-helix transcriptional regulator [Herbiconiux liangxiaofengii]|uniref:MarR family winged helix-turn-helix transcriptional regulator n=1 Tax=Herbiconiux liangxiaofengii TaxID=3342795 RepID=UPI0035B9E559
MADDLDFGWALGVLFRSWQSAVTEAVGELPRGPRGYQILNTLAADPGRAPTQAELATHLGIDRTVLTYVIDDLVASGLIERRVDARDRRVRRLALTDTGSTRLMALRSRVATAEADLLPGLAPAEAESLRTLLERAAAGVHLGRGEHDACGVVAAILADADGAAAAAGAGAGARGSAGTSAVRAGSSRRE